MHKLHVVTRNGNNHPFFTPTDDHLRSDGCCNIRFFFFLSNRRRKFNQCQRLLRMALSGFEILWYLNIGFELAVAKRYDVETGPAQQLPRPCGVFSSFFVAPGPFGLITVLVRSNVARDSFCYWRVRLLHDFCTLLLNQKRE